MSNDQHEERRAKVTPEHREEAKKLKAIWDQTAEKRAAAGVGSQLAFGAFYNVGTQGAVGFFLNGRTPLSVKAARGFADGLGCKVSDFSPRLASLMEPDLQAAVAQATDIAGHQLSDAAIAQRLGLTPRALSLARRFDSLHDEEHRRIAYALMNHALQQFEQLEPPPAPPAEPRASRRPRRSPGGGS